MVSYNYFIFCFRKLKVPQFKTTITLFSWRTAWHLPKNSEENIKIRVLLLYKRNFKENKCKVMLLILSRPFLIRCFLKGYLLKRYFNKLMSLVCKMISLICKFNKIIIEHNLCLKFDKILRKTIPCKLQQ